MHKASQNGHRLQFIDAARGCAMMFVLLSHFGFTYFAVQRDPLPTLMRLIGMVASPTFVTVSGILLGFLYRSHADDFGRIRIRLVDRGLFLLTVGHLAMLIAHPMPLTARYLFLTDTLGLSMIVGTWLVVGLRPRDRALVALATFSFSWMAIEWWYPNGTLAKALKDTFFGSLSTGVYSYSFPVLPWLSLYVGSSALGDGLSVHYIRGDVQGAQRLLAKTAVYAIATAVGLKATYLTIQHVGYGSAQLPAIRALTSVFQKEPPTPTYFLFYGAIGIGLVSACLVWERGGLFSGLLSRAAVLGQTSLFAFVLQWYVYFPLLNLVRGHLPYASMWPMYFVVSILLVVLPAFAWHKRHFNRFITVGYRHFCESRPPKRRGDDVQGNLEAPLALRH